MEAVETKIQEILDRGLDVPYVFRSALSKDLLYTNDEEILDVIFLAREYVNNLEKIVWAKAKMLIATSHGVIVIEEDPDETKDIHLGGYRLKQFMYDRIVSLEVENSLLHSILKIEIDTCGNNEICIEYNPAMYEKNFLEFINVVNKRMIEIKSIN